MPLIFILPIQFPTGGCLELRGLLHCKLVVKSGVVSIELGIEALKKRGEDRGDGWGGGGGLIHGNL